MLYLYVTHEIISADGLQRWQHLASVRIHAMCVAMTFILTGRQQELENGVNLKGKQIELWPPFRPGMWESPHVTSSSELPTPLNIWTVRHQSCFPCFVHAYHLFVMFYFESLSGVSTLNTSDEKINFDWHSCWSGIRKLSLTVTNLYIETVLQHDCMN